MLDNPLHCEFHADHGTRVVVVHTTGESGLRVGAAMEHEIDGSSGVKVQVDSQAYTDGGVVTATALLKPGQRLHMVKFVAYGWSGSRTLPAVRDQVWAALVAAKQSGWDGLVAEQRAYLDDFWDRADVELEGDPEVQQAVRFGLFHVLQAGARAETRAIPAKGLTGTGYEARLLGHRDVRAARTHLTARRRRRRPALAAHDPSAGQRAGGAAGLHGAAFPWRTIAGEECSGYWPAGTAAFHINADIADAVMRYMATGEKHSSGDGLDLLVETARLWRPSATTTPQAFRIDGVTGPDEYSALADNNVYTNLMAQHNLVAAADAAKRYPGGPANSGSTRRNRGLAGRGPGDVHPLRRARGPPPGRGIHAPPAMGLRHTTPDQYPLLLHFPYFDLYRKQVVKQADLVLAMHLRGDAFTPEQKARNFAYYEPLTVRDPRCPPARRRSCPLRWVISSWLTTISVRPP